MRKSLLVFAVLLGFAGSGEVWPLQITASQAPPSSPPPKKEICPLQLDVDLSVAALKKSFVDIPVGRSATFPTSQYVCDKARVERISVTKVAERAREVQLDIAVQLATEWVRQDVNLGLQFLVDGKVERENSWLSLTIGTTQGGAAYIPFGGSSPKVRELKWWVSRSNFERWFSAGKPSVRVRLEIVN